MKKRSLIVMVLAIVCVLLLSACGTKSKEQTETATQTVSAEKVKKEFFVGTWAADYELLGTEEYHKTLVLNSDGTFSSVTEMGRLVVTSDGGTWQYTKTDNNNIVTLFYFDKDNTIDTLVFFVDESCLIPNNHTYIEYYKK